MIRCPFCNATFPDNTLFCEECGSFIAPSGQPAVDVRPEQPAGEGDRAYGERSKYRTVVLAIQGGGRFELPLSAEIVLGRLDASRAIFPDVDLTAEGGLEQGISRRHARITRHDDEVYIEDLNSLNGTFLNANRLVAELPYPVKEGDQIQLGKLVMTIHLK